MSACCGTNDPVPMPPLRAGEIDGRFIDVSADLGLTGDLIPALGNVTISIARGDGAAMTGDDLQVAGSDWPNTLDSSGLVLTIGLKAPFASAGENYWITLMVDRTIEGRRYVRDMTMTVQPAMG